MSKKLPLTRRLQIALQETSSDSDNNIIYGLLYQYIEKNLGKCSDEFYGQLNNSSLSPLKKSKKDVKPEDIKEGKKISQYLVDSVVLPIPSHTSRYRSKMLKAIDFEFELLRERFYEND